ELISGSGKLAWSARLRVFGDLQQQQANETECPIRFQGQWHDDESGLCYNRFRYYEPATGSYLSPDPTGLRGGCRPYGYVHDPLGWIDPSGLGWNPGKAAAKGYTGIGSTPGGGPDFSGTKYLYPAGEGQQSIVQIQMQGSRPADFTQAFEQAGISRSDAKGYTWHHVDDFDPATGKTTMQLVKTDAHQATAGHSGSVKQYETEYGVKYGSQESRAIASEEGWRVNCK
ncbi:MAG TPA: RHS repeat-associated core domain-containing protein, partial [Blastocatellia bacterium]|nr:RHS repeat-associated core domain-containing protein [Blastocatellia bacterium]